MRLCRDVLCNGDMMEILLQSLALLLCFCAPTLRPAMAATLEQRLAAEIDQCSR